MLSNHRISSLDNTFQLLFPYLFLSLSKKLFYLTIKKKWNSFIWYFSRSCIYAHSFYIFTIAVVRCRWVTKIFLVFIPKSGAIHTDKNLNKNIVKKKKKSMSYPPIHSVTSRNMAIYESNHQISMWEDSFKSDSSPNTGGSTIVEADAKLDYRVSILCWPMMYLDYRI